MQIIKTEASNVSRDFAFSATKRPVDQLIELLKKKLKLSVLKFYDTFSCQALLDEPLQAANKQSSFKFRAISRLLLFFLTFRISRSSTLKQQQQQQQQLGLI